MSKSNSFIKSFKNINKLINNLLEENLNKLKFKNLRNLLRNNKIVLTLSIVVILFISYLSLPIFYKQDQISKKLKLDLHKKLKLNFNFTKKLTYNIFPKPHFIIKDSVILFKNNEISKVKNLKIYISIDNLFSIKDINIDDLLIENANFNLNNKNYFFFIDLLKNNFLDHVIKIKNSKVFFRNSKKDVLFLDKIIDMKYYYDHKESKNIIISKNELFNFPYEIKINDDVNKKKLTSIITLNFFNLKIQNEFDYNNKIKEGKAYIVKNKSKSNFFYKTTSNFFKFTFVDRKENPDYSYQGEININPFYSSFEGESQKFNLSYLFDTSSFLPQILKTRILNNENIDFELNIKAQNVFDNNSLTNFNLNSKIKGGLIDIDETNFQWKDFADFKLTDSLIFVKDGQLTLDAKLEINITSINEIYKYLLTPKNLRKNLNQVILNFSYNLDQNILKLRDIRLDEKYNQNINKVINSIILKDNKVQNKILLKNLLNEALKYY